jgi:hypothetical protein
MITLFKVYAKVEEWMTKRSVVQQNLIICAITALVMWFILKL